MKTKIIFFLLTVLLSTAGFSQSAEPEMADAFRSNGKIYVVLACVLMVLAGMISFLLWLEKRVSKLEKS